MFIHSKVPYILTRIQPQILSKAHIYIYIHTKYVLSCRKHIYQPRTMYTSHELRIMYTLKRAELRIIYTLKRALYTRTYSATGNFRGGKCKYESQTIYMSHEPRIHAPKYTPKAPVDLRMCAPCSFFFSFLLPTLTSPAALWAALSHELQRVSWCIYLSECHKDCVFKCDQTCT